MRVMLTLNLTIINCKHAACKCGVEEQNADHTITSCPIFYHPNWGLGLESVDEEKAV